MCARSSQQRTTLTFRSNKNKNKGVPLYSIQNINNEENPQIYCKNIYTHDPRVAYVATPTKAKTMLPVPEGYWRHPLRFLPITAPTKCAAAVDYVRRYYSRSMVLLVTGIYSVYSSRCVKRQLLLYPTITHRLENCLSYLECVNVFQMA